MIDFEMFRPVLEGMLQTSERKSNAGRRSMGGLVYRGVGIIRAKANVAMTNLTYNIARLSQIYRYHRGWLIV